MPLFFFHFVSKDEYSRDGWGSECDSAEEAYVHACAAAQAMWPELLEQKIDPSSCSFEIMDRMDNRLFTVRFGELVERCRPPIPPIADCDVRVAIGSQ